MIAILKINSADIINEVQSDTLALCLIPNNRLRIKLSELPIIREIINQNVDVEEKSEPIDPDDYIFIDDVPEFFWKFIKYALTKPEKISPTNFTELFRLLQANTSQLNKHIFNWADNSYSLVNMNPTAGIRISSATETYQGYTFTGSTSFVSENKFYARQNILRIDAEVQLPAYANENNSISIYEPTSNYLHPNNWIHLIKTGYKNFQLATRTSTASGYTLTLNLDLTFTGGDEQYIAYHPITLTAITKPSTSTFGATLQAEYYVSRNGNTRTEKVTGTGNLVALPEEVQERIGAYKQYKPSSAGIQGVNSTFKYIKYKSTITDITTNQSTVITYIDYDKSKKINDKLLMIV